RSALPKHIRPPPDGAAALPASGSVSAGSPVSAGRPRFLLLLPVHRQCPCGMIKYNLLPPSGGCRAV
ncbi:DUF4250 domain-containing protein, partial [Dysosmobacter welbionis]